MAEQDLTGEERVAIAALEGLAKRWPPSLMLLSTEGRLEVIHAADYHGMYDLPDEEREALTLATIHEIGNDGGAG
jgi:hypothetical protein